MPHDAYPCGADLAQRLRGMNADADQVAALDAEGALSDAMFGAITEWETRTGFTPFLAPAGDVTRVFDPMTRPSSGVRLPGSKRLQFRAGLISLTSLTVTGTVFTAGIDFFLGPDNAPAEGKPWTYANFLSPLFGLPQTIAVTGRWGYAAAIPDDVWNALLQYGQSIVAPDLSFAISGGLAQFKADIVTEVYAGTGSNGPLALQMDAWPAAFKRALRRYKRVTI